MTFDFNELRPLMPVTILGVGAMVALLGEVSFKDRFPRVAFSALVLLSALFQTVIARDEFQIGKRVFAGMFYSDPFTFFCVILICVGSLLALLLGWGGVEKEGVESPGEYYSLYLIASAGAVIFSSSADLILLFLGLEVMSMALYCLCGSAIGKRSSSESALKYFLLGSFSSAFLLYGIALLYGLTGSLQVPEIRLQLSALGSSPLLFVSIGLMLFGFGFKVAAVPFHFWAPDVYQGAPTSVTAYMACVIKAAAVAALLRVMWGVFSISGIFAWWSDAVWLLAVLTMIAGNLLALRQRSVKRMLAYSSIAHAGYMMCAVLVPDGGGAAIMYYLSVYTAMTLGAFGVVMVVSSSSGSDDISQFRGLGFSRPGLGILMTIFMFALAGLPPGFSGLVGKVYIFTAIVSKHYIGLAIVGVLCSAVSCFYYLRVLVAMYFSESETSSDVQSRPALSMALFACATATILFGLFPSALYHFAETATKTLGL